MIDWFLDDRGDWILSRMAIGAFVGIFLLIALMSSFYTVDAGERAVIFDSIGGGVIHENFDEGLHMKVPFFQSAHIYDVKAQLYEAEAESGSNDLQRVDVLIAVRYRVDNNWAWWLHQNYGTNYRDIVIDPAVQESVKATTAKHDAVNIIQNRTVVREQIKSLLKEKLDEVHLDLVEMDIKDIQFTDAFAQSIEDKEIARQKALEEKNRLEAVKNRKKQVITEAQGEAESARIINQQLQNQTRGYLTWLFLQQWNGELPKFMGGGQISVAALFDPGVGLQTSTTSNATASSGGYFG